MDDNEWGAGDYLAFVYTIGFLFMVGGVMWLAIPKDNVQIVNTLVTIMSTIQIGIGKCYYDRSKADSAAQKKVAESKVITDAAIIEIAKAAPMPAAPPTPAVTPAPADPITGVVPAAEALKSSGDKP
jgi:hypothetical protein